VINFSHTENSFFYDSGVFWGGKGCLKVGNATSFKKLAKNVGLVLHTMLLIFSMK